VQSTSRAPDWTPVASAAATAVAAPRLAYAEFAAAVKDALRDANRPDLLARNPLLRDGICNHGGSAGPQELRSLLCETVGTLFGNPRDETLRRVLELTYGHAALKQEVVADRFLCPSGPTAVTSAPRASAWRVGYGKPTRMRKPNLSCRLRRSRQQRRRSGEARRQFCP
jgi:hypothetical protein